MQVISSFGERAGAAHALDVRRCLGLGRASTFRSLSLSLGLSPYEWRQRHQTTSAAQPKRLLNLKAWASESLAVRATVCIWKSLLSHRACCRCWRFLFREYHITHTHYQPSVCFKYWTERRVRDRERERNPNDGECVSISLYQSSYSVAVFRSREYIPFTSHTTIPTSSWDLLQIYTHTHWHTSWTSLVFWLSWVIINYWIVITYIYCVCVFFKRRYTYWVVSINIIIWLIEWQISLHIVFRRLIISFVNKYHQLVCK